MDYEALNRISSDSGTGSCASSEMDSVVPEKPPRGVRPTSTSPCQNIVHLRRIQFERLCMENREDGVPIRPHRDRASRPTPPPIPPPPVPPRNHETPKSPVSHHSDEEEAEEEEEATEEAQDAVEVTEEDSGLRDSKLSVEQSHDNEHPHQEDHYSDFDENDREEDHQPAIPVIEVKNTEVYEEDPNNAAAYDDYSDSSFDTDSDDEDYDEQASYLQVPQQSRPVSQESISTHLLCLVEELVRTEETYVNNIKVGMEGYTKVLDPKERPGEVPMTLRGKINVIFGNLKRVYVFHKGTLLPELQACGSDDVEKIAKVFMKLINEDYFYCHVIYAMNYSKAKKICEDHAGFFAGCKEEIGDRLGIQSLLLQPIQRMPRYVMLLENILKEMAKHLEDTPEIKNQVAALSRALKAVMRLTKCVNASMNVNDIVECYEINLFHQGKFRDFDPFDLYDNETRRRYKGHLFLFEKCIVYTENKQSLEKPTFLYRGHYALTMLGMLPDSNRGKLSIFRSRLGQQQLDIYAPSPSISKWEEYLTSVLRKAGEEAKLEQSKTKVNRQTYQSIVPEFRSSTRGSIMSNISFSSTSSDYRSSQSSRELDLDSRKTTWYDSRNLQRLLNSEKHYVSMMHTYKKKLLDHLAVDARQMIDGYIRCVEAICTLHRERFLPRLRACDMNIEDICNLFNDFISDGSFGIYMTYATETMSVHQILLDYNVKFLTEEIDTKLDWEEVEQGIKVFLQLPMKRLHAYEGIIHFILECFFSEGVNPMSPIFKVAAIIEAELRNLAKSVENNFKVFTCPDFRMSRQNVGFVRYADDVAAKAFGSFSYTILLLERQVVCCKNKKDEDTSYFPSLLFNASYDNLILRESKLNANRLKFCLKNGDQAVYPLIFRTQDNKQLFMRKFSEFYRRSIASRT
ncbi:hypothetical protein DMENIID0001_055370 [Sergentomyia squamirostris]